jgi:energy-converting hydrogenase Eha subunit B
MINCIMTYLWGYRKGYVAAGIILTLTSVLFLVPYIAPSVNYLTANVTESPINVTGLDPHDTIRVFIFAILFCSGVGLLVKGFI